MLSILLDYIYVSLFIFTIFSFEKCASGRYLGELMRLVIEKLVQEKVLFGGQASELMSTQYEFKSEYITEIEQ